MSNDWFRSYCSRMVRIFAALWLLSTVYDEVSR